MKRVLVIDSDEQGRFFLVLADGALTIGAGPDDVEVALRDLHIQRIHCEFEVTEDVVAVSAPGSVSADQQLHAGEELHVGTACLRLTSAPEAEKAATLDESASSSTIRTPVPARLAGAAPTVKGQLKRLLVIDGADEKEVFTLPESGSISIGNTGRNADIGLHDFYVSGIHSRLEIQGDKIIVSHNEGKNGTLVNGQRITQPQELQLGDVLRVGNSHLRLELAGGMSGEGRGMSGEGRVASGEKSSAPAAATAQQASSKSGVIAMAPAATSAPSRQTSEASLPVAADQLKSLEGQAVGHYLLGSMLGSGHSAQVFRAQDTRTNQIVALKVLAAEFPANAAELQQFAQALKVATPLRHANLITLFGAGKSGPRCWIAREYVDGESADRLVRRLKEEGKLNWMRGLRVAVHLGTALAFLHEHKAVHGNITPRNVLVASEDKTTKLADLMLAQAVSGSRLQNAVLEKKLLSELPFMAPEQVEPDAFIDHLADLYALGAVVYSFITGEPPFTASSPEKLIAKIQEAQVVKPSRYQPKIPFPFEGVVLKLLAKRQEDRYQTATELMADLDVLAHDHQIKV